MADKPPVSGIRVHLGYFGPKQTPGGLAAIRPRMCDEPAACPSPPRDAATNVTAAKQMDSRISISLNVD